MCSPISLKVECSIRPDLRRYEKRRESSLAGAGSCAISEGGRSKKKSDVLIISLVLTLCNSVAEFFIIRVIRG